MGPDCLLYHGVETGSATSRRRGVGGRSLSFGLGVIKAALPRLGWEASSGGRKTAFQRNKEKSEPAEAKLALF